MLRNSVKMQDDNDNEQTQIATTHNVAIERKNSRNERSLSNQTAHGHTRLKEDGELKVLYSSVKTSTDLVQHQVETSHLSRNRRISEFESLLCRSHSVDESTIQTMSSGKSPKSTIINDSIHGHIHFGPHAMAIIDTPQFQRLRNIKQVGSCHWVYPNATHSRFQHSLGVAHLARKFAEHLRSQYPSLVDEKDVKCVELAGLCHDLGHGPFSHLWEGFVHEAEPDSNWHHEDNSIEMLDYLIEDNNLKDILLQEEITDQDILFIKEMIAGYINPFTGLPGNPEDSTNGNIENGSPENGRINKWYYRGRPEEKSFLYEIVANKISGVDVDKWDYFLRDKEYLKVNTVFDYQRFIMYSRIIKTGNPPRLKICIRDKEAENLLDMFQDRARLHRQGYQHRVVKIIDRMLVDAFLASNSYISIKGKNGKSYKLSEACKDIVAHEKMTDSVFDKILDSECDEAKNLLRRIQKRQFYKSIAEIRPLKGDLLYNAKAKDIENDIKQLIPQKQKLQNGNNSSVDDPSSLSSSSSNHNSEGPLTKEEIIVIVRRVTMGMGSRNPIERVTFFSKHGNEETLSQIDSQNMNFSLPDHVLAPTIWVCCKRIDARALKEAVSTVNLWAKQKNIQINLH